MEEGWASQRGGAPPGRPGSPTEHPQASPPVHPHPFGRLRPSEQGLPSLAADKRPFLSYTENVLLCQRAGKGCPAQRAGPSGCGQRGVVSHRNPW